MLEKFTLALKQTKLGKSPGPDGFSAAYYKTFSDLLAHPFLLTFNLLLEQAVPQNKLLEAHISVIPKPEKDSTAASNYSPISFLNVDIKIFANILANRILPILTSLIAKDQVGFVPGREARNNTLKALNIHHWLTKFNKHGFFLSLDAEKAFDRLAWDYLEAILHSIGLGDRMIRFIMSLSKGKSTGQRPSVKHLFYPKWYAPRMPPFPHIIHFDLGTLPM